MAAGVVHIPWYATVFRGDKLSAALAEIAPLAQRYGAGSYAVYRYADDRYKFLQTAKFETKLEWDRYWASDDFVDWRIRYQSYYQVPVIYGWTELVSEGSFSAAEAGVAPAGTTQELAG